MVDSVELQQMARLVDMNRQRLEEIQNQLEKVEVVILEHDDAHKALTTLAKDKSGHIPIGAGVMVETKEKSTTLVDFGSGIFGQATPADAANTVSKRLEDLIQLKSQFESEAAQLTQRIEQLALHFEQAAKEISTANKVKSSNEEPEEQTPLPKTRKKRSFGSELTLDD
tara:strand:+ start:3870 stop:4376 length:507 start_codon:yes stop_codon:yes gene_type:complete